MKFAVITMARNDDFFLSRWVAWYGDAFGRENLYIVLDGKDQVAPPFTSGCNVQIIDKIRGGRVALDKTRIGIINDLAAELRLRYDVVLGMDCDEFLVVDPSVSDDLKGTLEKISARHPGWKSVSGLGLDVAQNTIIEDVIDPSRTFLSQRSFAYVNSRYTKPVVTFAPCRWGSGFHRIKGENYHIASHLYLLHFGSVDLERIRMKMASAEMKKAGWEKHLARRTKSIRAVTSCRPRSWAIRTRLSRLGQTVFRQVFAWNKPYKSLIKKVVRIPERFSPIGL